MNTGITAYFFEIYKILITVSGSIKISSEKETKIEMNLIEINNSQTCV
jgi:hypothetical protein